jgi:alginate O-acetyltransferase complex protein AlgI
MLFTSFAFLLFLPSVFILYWFVFNKSLSIQNSLLLLASYFFYGWWSYKFLGLLILSTLLDYFYGFSVASSNRKKAKLFLVLSIVNNLGVLAIFKYYNFFAKQLQDVLQSINIKIDPLLLHVALPVGISFYTFHGLSYVFDIYRKKQTPVKNFVDYAVFVCFFPLLVAGPIERAGHLLPQVQIKRKFKYSQAVEGCKLIVWGLFKKIVIADTLSSTVDTIFSSYRQQSGVSLIIGAVLFSFQIYTDFSGYTDIALGVAKLFGFELLSNFKFPYFSRDIAEFWRRWHISLSSWFRDYIYIPLGGSKEGRLKAIRNVFIIFLISGFWHGANWTYICWGLIHACLFLPLLLVNKNRKHISEVVASHTKLPTLKEFFQILVTFAFVTLAWIFFRAPSIYIAIDYLKTMVVSFCHDPKQLFSLPQGNKEALLYCVIFVALDWYLRHDERKLKFNKLMLCGLVLAIIYFTLYHDADNNFIYFAF